VLLIVTVSPFLAVRGVNQKLLEFKLLGGVGNPAGKPAGGVHVAALAGEADAPTSPLATIAAAATRTANRLVRPRARLPSLVIASISTPTRSAPGGAIAERSTPGALATR
jgi:hypothetical protein